MSDQSAEQPVPVDLTVEDAIKLIAAQNLPLEMGSIRVDDQGRVHRRDSRTPLRFCFTFHGLLCNAEVVGGDDPLVTVTADLGPLPYTAESPECRRSILRAMVAAGTMARGRLALSKTQNILFQAGIVPPAPATPVSIMASLVSILLDFKPYLDLLGEIIPGRGGRWSAARVDEINSLLAT